MVRGGTPCPFYRPPLLRTERLPLSFPYPSVATTGKGASSTLNEKMKEGVVRESKTKKEGTVRMREGTFGRGVGG